MFSEPSGIAIDAVSCVLYLKFAICATPLACSPLIHGKISPTSYVIEVEPSSWTPVTGLCAPWCASGVRQKK